MSEQQEPDNDGFLLLLCFGPVTLMLIWWAIRAVLYVL